MTDFSTAFSDKLDALLGLGPTQAVPGFVPQPKQLKAQQLADDPAVFELLYGGSAGGGKALALDTPIPTVSGWTTMGQISVGDQVFDENGQPCNVVGVTEVMHGRPCYRLTLDDGTVFVADAGHEWHTFTAADRAAAARRTPEFRARRRANRPRRGTGKRPDLAARNAAARTPLPPPTGAVRTTRDIHDTLRVGSRTNHSIQVAGALSLPEADLPIDPYVLGCWLGDGTTGSGAHGYTIRGLIGQLRAAGVLGDKHVPPAYLRASTGQRLALLQGLMDTGGSALADGQVEFTGTNERLCAAVFELAASLGLKPTMREGRATLRGVGCGPKWRVFWTATLPVFRLPRKLERLPQSVRGTQGWRFIVDCEPVESVPVRCIQVDSPSHLYLAGRTMVPTHNSYWMRADAIRFCLNHPGANVAIVRRTLPMLRKTHHRPLMALCDALATHNKAELSWSFPNGSSTGRTPTPTTGQKELPLMSVTITNPQAFIHDITKRVRAQLAELPTSTTSRLLFRPLRVEEGAEEFSCSFEVAYDIKDHLYIRLWFGYCSGEEEAADAAEALVEQITKTVEKARAAGPDRAPSAAGVDLPRAEVAR